MATPRAAILSLAIVTSLLIAGCAGGRPPDPVSRELHGGHLAPPTRAIPDSLLVVSYNIAYGREHERAVRELQAHPRLRHADVLLLQEMNPTATEAMARALQMDWVDAPGYIHSQHDRRYGTAVLSRWPIIASRGLVLPHANPFSDNHRRAVAVDLAVGGRRLRVVSVHLATPIISFDDRLDQLATVIDSLATVSWPTIIGGDFNTVTAAEALDVRQAMRRAGFAQARMPDQGTAPSLVARWLGQSVVLDHMFHRGLEPGATAIATDIGASDHWPVVVAYGWPPPSAAARPARMAPTAWLKQPSPEQP